MAKLGEFFNYRGGRYFRIYKGGLSRDLALEKVDMRRRLAPQFKWVIHKESDGTYSVGRTSRK